jgi:hypothetical protein
LKPINTDIRENPGKLLLARLLARSQYSCGRSCSTVSLYDFDFRE